MSATVNRCAFCYGPLPADAADTVHVVRLDGGVGGVVELRWHLAAGCADKDPLHLRMADALGQPDGADSDDAARMVYSAVRDRAMGHDADNPRRSPVLREVVKIRRDTQSMAETLRGRGAAWGRLSPRERRR